MGTFFVKKSSLKIKVTKNFSHYCTIFIVSRSRLILLLTGISPVNTIKYFLTGLDIKYEKILRGSLDSIPSPSVKIQIMGRKVGLRCKSKKLLGFVNKLFRLKSLLTRPSNVLPKKIKTKNSNVHDSLKVMGWNPGYILKSSVL